MKFRINTFVAVVLIALLAGCSSKGGPKSGDDVSIEDRGTSAEDGAVASGLGAGVSLERYLMDNPDSPLASRVIYFEYDSAEIAAADVDVLTAHAGYLGANPGQRVTLEGHTDERGSREYNIALGERRSQSVQRVLELNGVSPDQLTNVSYGEEKPAVDGNSETAWRLNRRVEIIYQGQ
ncbi:MAG: peptidoglycan-associated lipoprotein Pal [Gammaproteobacteria bacterium]